MTEGMEVTLKGTRDGEVVKFDKRSHVELSDGVYEKKDRVFVVNIGGRYYRKESPLVVKLEERHYGDDQYALKEDTDIARNTVYGDSPIFLRDDLAIVPFLRVIGEDVVTESLTTNPGYVTNRFQRTKYIDNNGQTIRGFVHVNEYTEGIRAGVLVRDVGGSICSKQMCVPLGKSGALWKFVGNQLDKLLVSKSIVKYDDVYYISGNIEWSYDLEGRAYKPIRCALTGDKIDKRSDPFARIPDVSVIVQTAKNIMSGSCSVKKGMKSICFHKHNSRMIDSDFSTGNIFTKMGIAVSTNEDAEVLNDLHDYLVKIDSKDLSIILKKRSWFGFLSPEKTPDLYPSFSIDETGGDYVFHKSRRNGIQLSPSLSGTGGIGYTFGVELETSFGVLPRIICDQVGLDGVGDRSIGAMEYVTEPLHGTKGMNKLEYQTNLLSRYCAVDDRCGVHVHVGGAKGAETPVFNRMFSVLSIMLGTQIEKELFSLLPDNRMEGRNSNGIPYCGSILEFKGTNKLNGRKMLSRFVFGHDDGFDDREFVENGNVPDNSRHELNRWASTRYKWLNLINCNTDNSRRRNGGGFVTIEFRAFNGSLLFDDIRAFVLLSLSFVRFVENHSRLIEKGGVTLDVMLSSTLNTDAYSYMKNWIKLRSDKIKEVRKMGASFRHEPLIKSKATQKKVELEF